jgi:tetratricopeptide (TPR) repeat protein
LPAPAPAAAAPRARAEPKKKESAGNVPVQPRDDSPRLLAEDAFAPEPPRRMIPMRRIWERVGAVITDRTIPKQATVTKIRELERELERDENRREIVKNLFALYAVSGDVERAQTLAERWSSKEPLDPDALTARADLAARRGDRELAIRILGSVVDVRPDDVKSQQRLARLHRWAGRPVLGCRHAIAIAQLRSGDPKLLADAVACTRETGESLFAEELLAAADDSVRKRAEPLIAKAGRAPSELSGDLRIEANWRSGDSDLDLSILHPEGHRVSWLGAPTRGLISANDVTSTHGEGLALRGAAPGEYVIEVVRASGSGPVHGALTITVAGTRKTVPFVLERDRAAVGIASIRMQSRLVPL